MRERCQFQRVCLIAETVFYQVYKNMYSQLARVEVSRFFLLAHILQIRYFVKF